MQGKLSTHLFAHFTSTTSEEAGHLSICSEWLALFHRFDTLRITVHGNAPESDLASPQRVTVVKDGVVQQAAVSVPRRAFKVLLTQVPLTQEDGINCVLESGLDAKVDSSERPLAEARPNSLLL